jgi:endothelin-converting enzyme/putative endopeptidase
VACALLAGAAAQAAEIPERMRYGAFGVDLSARDLTVRPGDDFWAYANGAWSARTPIPADTDAVGVSPQLSRDAEQQVRALLEDLAYGPNARLPNGQRLGDLYASWLDEAGVEARGIGAAKPYLARIARARTPADIQALFATAGYSAPITFEVLPAPTDRARNLVFISQGGLGMPRDYFLNDREPYAAYRAAYRDYVETLLARAGFDDAAGKADAILALETEIAKSQWSQAESRDESRNAVLSLDALSARAPRLDWIRMLRAAGFQGTSQVVIGQDTALIALGRMVAEKPVSLWRDYLALRFLSEHADYLPRAFSEPHAAFYGVALSGVTVAPPRWKRGVVLLNGEIGDAVGAAYAARYLSSQTERRVKVIIDDVGAALRTRIEQSLWMDAATKAGALEKLAALRARIGAPNDVPDYAALRVDRGDLLGNMVRLARFHRQVEREKLARVNGSVDWPMTPQIANGYYYAPANTIVLNAALLQPPLFDPHADPAVNYGAIGAFIGHEIGHAFDDQGSRYDAKGEVRDWWSAGSRAAFAQRMAALQAQYDGYEALPGLKVNGALTLGENIADLGGVEAAYAAYKRYQAREGQAPLLEGLSGDQRFFLANAQMRRVKLREDVARQLAAVDTHAPSVLRVDGTFRNVDAWYAAFDIRPTDGFYLSPGARLHVW